MNYGSLDPTNLNHEMILQFILGQKNGPRLSGRVGQKNYQCMSTGCTGQMGALVVYTYKMQQTMQNQIQYWREGQSGFRVHPKQKVSATTANFKMRPFLNSCQSLREYIYFWGPRTQLSEKLFLRDIIGMRTRHSTTIHQLANLTTFLNNNINDIYFLEIKFGCLQRCQ